MRDVPLAVPRSVQMRIHIRPAQGVARPVYRRESMDGPSTAITVREASSAAGELVAECEGQRVGSLIYSRRDGATLTIEHVFVLPEARGGRVGRVLVEAAVALARREDARVVAVCGYARLVLRRTSTRAAAGGGEARENSLNRDRERER